MAKTVTSSTAVKNSYAKKIFYSLAALAVVTAVIATCNSDSYNKPFLHVDINKPGELATSPAFSSDSLSKSLAAESDSTKKNLLAAAARSLMIRNDSAATARIDSISGLTTASTLIANKAAIKLMNDSLRKNRPARARSVSGSDRQDDGTAEPADKGTFADLKSVKVQQAKETESPAVLPVPKPLNTPLEIYSSGDLRAKLQDYAGAVVAYSTAIALKPDSSTGYTKRANVKLSMNNYPGAISDFTRAITLNTDDRNAYKGRSVARLRLNDFSGSLSDYNKITGVTDLESAKGKGEIDLKEKDYARAVTAYTAAIMIDPLDKDAYRRRAEAKYYLKDYLGAAVDLSKAIHIDPDYTAAYINRGVIKSHLRQHDNAYIDFNRAKSLGYTDADIYIEKYCK